MKKANYALIKHTGCYSHGEFFELGKSLGYFGFYGFEEQKKRHWQK